jgi:hypothetical protein
MCPDNTWTILQLATSCVLATSCWCVQVGVHGLIIEFQDPVTRSRRSATFLPEVAADQGWDQQQTLAALVKKAGGWRPAGPGIHSCGHTNNW